MLRERRRLALRVLFLGFICVKMLGDGTMIWVRILGIIRRI